MSAQQAYKAMCTAAGAAGEPFFMLDPVYMDLLTSDDPDPEKLRMLTLTLQGMTAFYRGKNVQKGDRLSESLRLKCKQAQARVVGLEATVDQLKATNTELVQQLAAQSSFCALQVEVRVLGEKLEARTREAVRWKSNWDYLNAEFDAYKESHAEALEHMTVRAEKAEADVRRLKDEVAQLEEWQTSDQPPPLEACVDGTKMANLDTVPANLQQIFNTYKKIHVKKLKDMMARAENAEAEVRRLEAEVAQLEAGEPLEASAPKSAEPRRMVAELKKELGVAVCDFWQARFKQAQIDLDIVFEKYENVDERLTRAIHQKSNLETQLHRLSLDSDSDSDYSDSDYEPQDDDQPTKVMYVTEMASADTLPALKKSDDCRRRFAGLKHELRVLIADRNENGVLDGILGSGYLNELETFILGQDPSPDMCCKIEQLVAKAKGAKLTDLTKQVLAAMSSWEDNTPQMIELKRLTSGKSWTTMLIRNTQLKDALDKIKTLETRLRNAISDHRCTLDQLEEARNQSKQIKMVAEMDNQIYNEKMSSLETMLEEKADEIQNLQQKSSTREQKRIHHQRSQLKVLNAKVASQNRQLQEMETMLEQKVDEIQDLRQQLTTAQSLQGYTMSTLKKNLRLEKQLAQAMPDISDVSVVRKSGEGWEMVSFDEYLDGAEDSDGSFGY